MILPLLARFSNTMNAPDPDLNWLRFLWYGTLLANGLWQMVAGWLGVQHRQLPLRGVSASGIVAGGAWIVFIVCALLQSSPLGAVAALDLLSLVTLLVLVVSQTIWVVGLGLGLLRYPATDG